MKNDSSLKRNSSYFSANYALAKTRFLADVHRYTCGPCFDGDYSHPEDPSNLSIDLAWVGPKKARSVIVTLSGVHGVEGPIGSACQLRWLQHDIAHANKNLAFFHIHALNPWGFQHHRRTNENGVDLNRNALANFENLPANPLYEKFADILVPQNWKDYWSAFHIVKNYFNYVVRGRGRELQRAFNQGQYTHKDGVYYGGSEKQWSLVALDIILSKLMQQSDASFIFLDIHSGLGDDLGRGFVYPYTMKDRGVSDCLGTKLKPLSTTAMAQDKIPGDILGLVEHKLSDRLLFSGCLEFGAAPMIPTFLGLCKEASLSRQYQDSEKPLIDARKNLQELFYPDGKKRKIFETRAIHDAEGVMTSLLAHLR